MKKHLYSILAALTVFISANAQSLPSVSILGDSYSTFQDFLEPDTNAVWYKKIADKKYTDVASVQQTWWHQFIRENGYRLCVNNSFSGATICYTGYKDKAGKHQDYSDRSFITRANHLGCPDVIFIFGGTNDSWAGSPIGNYKYADWTRADLFSFRPAMACLLQTVIDYHPNVKIYFLLNNELRAEINESVKTVCAHYGVKCIELKDIDKQSGHPSVKGMKQISDQIKEFLSAEAK